MCNKEGEQKQGYPEIAEGGIAEKGFVGRLICGKGRRPYLRAEVAGHTDEGACEDEALCRCY